MSSPPTSLTCPLCSQLLYLPVTLLCCGVTTCEHCGLNLGRRGKNCICGVLVRGREDMLYNEDVKLKLERYNQNMSRKRVKSRDRSYEQTSRKKEKLDKEYKDCSVNDESPEYAEGLVDLEDNKLKDCKADYKEHDICEHEQREEKKFNSDYNDLKAEYKKEEKNYELTTKKNENEKTKSKDYGINDEFNNNESNSEVKTIHDDNDETERTEYYENLVERILSSTKKFKNILVFIDLQKLINDSGNPFSQVGCYFDESSFKNQIDEDEELQFQSFYAVTAPRLQEFNENPELWAKYFVFDEFYYKHPEQMIRCSSEKTVLEKLCQYLAKMKLKYREVNICVAQNKYIKDLIKRINLHNFGHVFFSNVDGYVTLEEVEKVTSIGDFLKKYLKLSSIPEHSDARSKLLFYSAFEPLSDNYWDIHKFPIFKGLSKNTKSESLEIKSKSLYIGDLSFQVTDKDLERKLSKVARPVSVKVCLHPKTGYSLGYAYANFDSEDKAENVLKEFQASPMLNKPMRIMYYNKKVVDRNSQLWKSNIFVKNLDSDVDSKRLQTAFSAYGEILSCKVETNDVGRSKCFGFVQYKTESSAWKAINDLHGLVINEKELYVCIKKSVRDRMDEERETLSGKLVEVRNLSPKTTNESFFALFNEFVANITSFALDVTRDGEKVGFVSFKSARFASEALYSLDRKEVDGFRLILVKQKQSAATKLKVLKKIDRKQKEVEKDKMMYRKTERKFENIFKEKKPKLDLRIKLINKSRRQ